MNATPPKPLPLPATIDATLELLAAADYVADRSLATVLFLALKMGRPLFLEGEAGVGKTEIGKVLSATLGRRLIRLQCYEGLDVAAAVYEWNYAAQMIAIRVAEAEGDLARVRRTERVRRLGERGQPHVAHQFPVIGRNLTHKHHAAMVPRRPRPPRAI